MTSGKDLEATAGAVASSETTAFKEYVQGLRDFADWAEKHPDEFAPWDLDDIYSVNLYRSTAEELRESAKALGGMRTKNVDSSYFRVERQFGPMRVYVYSGREQVCERIVTGTREVTETVRDPALMEKVPLVTVIREEEIVEWHCPDAILAEVTS